MKSSLFRDRPARKTRMTMMVAGAVLVHCGIIGVGAMWPQRVTEQEDDSTVVDVVGPGLEPVTDSVQYVTVDNSAPTPSQESSTPTPEVPAQSDPLPPEVVPEMSEPSDVTPPPRPRRASPHTTSLPRTTSGMPGAAGVNPGATATGPGGSQAGALGWKMPKPSYPVALRATGFQGTTTVRIATDAAGNVATVEIVRSAGNILVDRHTQEYVRAFWKGPPNATRTTEFVYQLF